MLCTVRRVLENAGSMCKDVPGWLDIDRYDCYLGYEHGSLCQDGVPTQPRRFYQSFAANGHSALTACCACGGGIEFCPLCLLSERMKSDDTCTGEQDHLNEELSEEVCPQPNQSTPQTGYKKSPTRAETLDF